MGPGSGDPVPGQGLAGAFHGAEELRLGGAHAVAARADSGGVEAAGPEERLRAAEGDSSDRTVLTAYRRSRRLGAVPDRGGEGEGGATESAGIVEPV